MDEEHTRGTKIDFLQPPSLFYHFQIITARSVKEEPRNGHRNAKRNPNRNHETVFLGLFSFENLKRDVEL